MLNAPVSDWEVFHILKMAQREKWVEIGVSYNVDAQSAHKIDAHQIEWFLWNSNSK